MELNAGDQLRQGNRGAAAFAENETDRPAVPGPSYSPGPWECVPSNENHGPYVVGPWGSDIADCYTMSNLSDRAVCNGGASKPIHFQNEAADANAKLIAAAPDLLNALLLVRKLIVEAAATGFNCHDGDWAERLFASQQVSFDAVAKAGVSPRT